MHARFPSVSEYRASLERPAELFRSIEIEEVCRDVYGEIELRNGNSAAVFRIRTKESAGKTMCLRCFRKGNPHLPAVYRYLSRCGSPLVSPCRYYEQEMCVATLSDARYRYYDVVLSEWVTGRTLQQCVASAAKHRDRNALERLAGIFDRMCARLLKEEWAHGDLKPDNIIITPSGHGRLIDYDAAYVPDSGFDSTPEIGTPAYQHPLRDTGMYDKHIDDYPIALLSANLHLIALAPHLMPDNDETPPLCATKIFSGDTAMLDTALRFFAEEADARNYRLCKLLASPTPYIENIEEFFADPRPCRQKLHPFQRNGLWGYADENGRIAIAPWWDEAFDFRGSAAVVRLEDKYHCIDECGRTIINGKRWDCMKLQGEGYAAVKSEGKWGYIGLEDGRPVTEIRYDRVGRVRDGRAEATEGGKTVFIEFSDR